jgi:hypothetical protein
MKARQTLNYTLLMQEVIEQLSSRFKPKIPLIKVQTDYINEHFKILMFLCFIAMY